MVRRQLGQHPPSADARRTQARHAGGCGSGHQEHATTTDSKEIDPPKLEFVEALGRWKIGADITNLRQMSLNVFVEYIVFGFGDARELAFFFGIASEKNGECVAVERGCFDVRAVAIGDRSAENIFESVVSER